MKGKKGEGSYEIRRKGRNRFLSGNSRKMGKGRGREREGGGKIKWKR